MLSRPTASVVIVNYNGLAHLDPCLEALRAQEVIGGLDVTVVDNHSGDGSVEHLRRYHRWARLITCNRNLGFAAANNLAVRGARGEHVVVLNNDTRVRPGWLAALVDSAEHHPGAGAVTSKLVFADRPEVIQNAGGILLTDGSGGDRGSGDPDEGQFDAPEEVFGFCGAAALLSRDAIEDVGLFDESFFMYYEDTDLSWRLRLRGWNILYDPRAVVEHGHSSTSAEWSDFFLFHVDRNRLLMILKNAPAPLVARSFSALGLRAARLRQSPGVHPPDTDGQDLSRLQPAAQKATRRIALRGRVLQSFLAHAPEALAARRQIRGRRSVPDSEVSRWMVPRAEWDARFA
ncbi:MAG: glycosyltransferase family 2 protein [Candidatus Dormibacteraeota bacterium]|nr:glycosyltransferase family 2 protein [Candidatus Dormibacteraeota bacterium]